MLGCQGSRGQENFGMPRKILKKSFSRAVCVSNHQKVVQDATTMIKLSNKSISEYVNIIQRNLHITAPIVTAVSL